MQPTFARVFRQHEHLQSAEFYFPVEKSFDDEVSDTLAARRFTVQVIAEWNLDVVEVEHRKRPRRHKMDHTVFVLQPVTTDNSITPGGPTIGVHMEAP